VQAALRELTSRDSFCAPEIDIFLAIQQWAERNADHQLTTSAMSTVRLPLIKLDDLLNVVRLSSLISADAILDAIKLKTECKDMELSYRGFLSLYHFCLYFFSFMARTTSAKCRHQSPDWTILSHVNRFIQGEVIGFQVLLDSFCHIV